MKYRVFLIFGLFLLRGASAFAGQSPQLAYSTYLGANGNNGINGMALDSAGNLYVVGYTDAIDFPIVNAFQKNRPAITECIAGFNPAPCNYAFIAKISADGSHLIYASYIGDAYSFARGIAVDSAGNAYVIGSTSNPTSFPTVPPATGAGSFVLKLNADGSAQTYSPLQMISYGIAVDSLQQVYIAGSCNSDLASTPGFNKLDASGRILVTTCLPAPAGGGAAAAIALDAQGNAYITGQISYNGFYDGYIDEFAAKLDTAGHLLYMTSFGGQFDDYGAGIAVDGNGNAWVSGTTVSPNFPILNAVRSAIPNPQGIANHATLVRLNASGTVTYSSLLGGNGNDVGEGVALDAAGNVYISGYTTSSNFPTVDPFQPGLAGGQDAFTTELSPDGSTILFSTYLGGSSDDAATRLIASPGGTVYLGGRTSSTDFPLMHPLQPVFNGKAILISQPADAFVTKMASIPASTAATPAIAAMTPGVAAVGTSFAATVSGQNLANPLAVAFSGSGVTASVQAGSTATSLVLSVSIAVDAPVGVYGLTVTTSSGITTLANALTVQNAAVPTTPPQPIQEVEDSSIQTGYVMVTPDAGNSTPVSSLTYGMVSGGVVQSQASILPTTLASDNILAVDILQSIGRNLGVAVLNASSSDSTVTFTLRNQDGTTAGSPMTQNLLHGTQTSRYVTELLPPATLGAAFRGSIEIQAPIPLSVIGLAFSGIQFSTEPVLTSSPAGATGNAVFPQFAMGGGWATKLVLVNPTQSLVTGTIAIYNSGGAPLTMPLNGVAQSTFRYSIAPNGTFTLAPRDINGQAPF